MNNDEFSQSRIATYLKCQRMYRYKYERSVSADEDKKALNFGRALHETIRETCDRVRDRETPTDDEIRALAEEAFQRQWRSEVNKDAYRTEAHYKDDEELARRAIKNFFHQGSGVDHARRSIAAEQPVAFERNGVTYTGHVDNILETGDGLELVDYKKSDISEPVSSRKNYIQLQNKGEYRPRRVKHAIQAALYIEGIKKTEYYDPGDEITFTYQPLAEASINRKGRSITVDFDIDPVSVEQDIQENSQTLWSIIEDTVERIQTGVFEPEPFNKIEEKQCDRCPFQPMCTAYLTAKEFKL